MKNLLTKLKILQERESVTPFKRTRIEQRLNPYNPLSYVVLIVVLLLGTVFYGVIGFWKTRLVNPFNWN